MDDCPSFLQSIPDYSLDRILIHCALLFFCSELMRRIVAQGYYHVECKISMYSRFNAKTTLKPIFYVWENM